MAEDIRAEQDSVINEVIQPFMTSIVSQYEASDMLKEAFIGVKSEDLQRWTRLESGDIITGYTTFL